MYNVRFLYQDYEQFEVQVEDRDLDKFFMAISENKPYYSDNKELAYWMPLTGVRAAFVQKIKQEELQQQDEMKGEELCQNQNWEAENVLQL